jgi:APA family basic amino acid/polyamine antiporter
VTTAPLARRLGTGDAVVIGLGSMIGAGVFSAFAPAARAAGSALLIGLAIAGGIAYCNAVASAQLAAQYPTSGGTYVYGRERLGEWWGFVAGWGFVIGKTASCAAMALTFASYAVGGPLWVDRLVAVSAVIVLTAANYQGISRTAEVARVLVGVSILALLVVVLAIATSGHAHSGVGAARFGVYGVLQAGGLLFFAFAGYARIATLGEEVKNPRETIPRAVPIALGIAAVASLGALLALIAGVGRTTLAMARHSDLPAWLSSVHPRHRVPDHAELLIGAAVVVLVLTTDLRNAIGFSSFGVLLYYAIANASAYTQQKGWRRWPRGLNIVGLVGCLVLVAALPWSAIAAGTAVIAVGLLGRALALRRRRVQAQAG